MRRNITILYTFILAIIIGVPLVLIESARENTMLLKSYICMDSGTESTLAEYHQKLYEDYQILAIDTSYLSGEADRAKLENKVGEFSKYNTGEDIGLLYKLRFGWIDLKLDSYSIEECLHLSDYNGDVFYKEAVEAQKYNNGMILPEKVFKFQRDMEVIEKNSEEFEAIKKKNSDNIRDMQESLSPEEFEEIKVWDKYNANSFVLDLSMGKKYQELYKDGLNTKELITGRSEHIIGDKHIEKMNFNLVDRCFFINYISDRFDSYDYNKDMKDVIFEQEYIIAGKENNIDNLSRVCSEIFAIRQAGNYISICKDKIASGKAQLIAFTISMLLFSPKLEEPIKNIIIMAWAVKESLEDMVDLLEGQEVPLIKGEDELKLDLQGMKKDTKNKLEYKKGMSYKDYLVILLWMRSRESLTKRSMDMVEQSIRKTKNNEDFKLDGCVIAYNANCNFIDDKSKTYSVSKYVKYR